MKTFKFRFITLLLVCTFSVITVFAQDYVSHKIAKGETLYSIAEKYGVTVDDIKKANPKVGNYFYAGLTIQIPNKKNGNTKTEGANNVINSVTPKQTNEDEPSNYFSTVNMNNNNLQEVNESDSYCSFSIGYWSYDGFNNWGMSTQWINPNGFGFEYNMRGCLKSIKKGGAGNYNVDILPNYTFELTNNNLSRLDFTIAAGPSVRYQDVITDTEIRGSGKNTYVDYEIGHKWYLDGYAQVALNAHWCGFYLSAGYNLWFPKFKTSSDYKSEGFLFKLGLNIK